MTSNRRSGRADYVLLGVIAILMMLGLQALYSASFALAMAAYNDPAYFVVRQVIFAVFGIGVLLFTWRVPFLFWKRLSMPIAGAAAVALVAVLIPGVGVSTYGAQRWISLGPLPDIQPAEFVKLAIIIYFSAWLTQKQKVIKRFSTGLAFCAMLGATALVMLAQPDLGSTTVVLASGLVLYYLAGAPSQILVLIFGGIAAASPLLLAASYRSQRWASFVDPWSDPLGNGFHIIQSLIALGSGGLTGLGFGSSRQKFFYIPGSHSDAIFAIIGEELGLIGTLAVIILFVFLGYRGFRIALRCPDKFGGLLAAGITTWLCVQAFINIGGITHTIPFTGIPLPFISYGGSSLLALMAAIGILLNISRFTSAQLGDDDADEPSMIQPRTTTRLRRAVQAQDS